MQSAVGEMLFLVEFVEIRGIFCSVQSRENLNTTFKKTYFDDILINNQAHYVHDENLMSQATNFCFSQWFPWMLFASYFLF